jgi:hypothetical protein
MRKPINDREVMEEQMRLSTYSLAAIPIAFVFFLIAGGAVSVDAQSKSDATFAVKLIDPDKKAAMREATVEVTTTGVELIDPAQANQQPAPGQGHLHYQVDKGPVIATPAAKLSFHELAPGPHTFVVTLVGNDHKPIAPAQTLKVTVPRAGMESTQQPAPPTAKPTSGAAPQAPPQPKPGY